MFTADLSSFSDFEDPLLALEVTSGAQLLAEKEAEDTPGLVKVEVKTEEVETSLVTPTKRKRSRTASTASSTKSRKMSVTKTIKREITSSAAARLYPTPPETPSSMKTEDFDYFGESPISLVERVKRTRRTSRQYA